MTDSSESKPVPDPTTLTTVQLEREILHLRELLESRLDQMDKALIEARARAELAISEFDASMTTRLALMDENMQARFVSVSKEFVTFKSFLDANATQAALSLDAADKAVDAAFASSKEAIGKAEMFNEKRFDLITRDIDELKTAQSLQAGKGQGSAALWGYIVGAVFLLIAVITFVNR